MTYQHASNQATIDYITLTDVDFGNSAAGRLGCTVWEAQPYKQFHVSLIFLNHNNSQ